jgi:hypothetical protein
MSCTAPPRRLTAKPWPSSCSSLMAGRITASSSRLPSASSRSPRWAVRSGQYCATRTVADPTSASHSAKPQRLNRGPTRGNSRVRKRSGFHSRKRSAIGFSRFCVNFRRARRPWRSKISCVSGGASPCSRSAAWSWPSRAITWSCPSAASPWVAEISVQTSSTVRLPSSAAMSAQAGGARRWTRPVRGSVSTYHGAPR